MLEDAPGDTEGQSGYCARTKVPPFKGQTSVKSKSWYTAPVPAFTCRFFCTPCGVRIRPRSFNPGTAWLYSVGVFSSRNSSEKKKKVLFFLVLNSPGMVSGPPIVPPKSCRR